MADTVVGQALSRVDARLKVTGAATYAAEHRFEGLLYGVIVNSTAARGTVSAIDVDAARAHPGVVRNADVPELDATFINTEDPQADPIGVKGLGEITIVGVPAAIGNAVFNATGKRLTDLPILLEALL
ncbi:hypothetical protein ACFWP7_26290 [Streptomyces sp. NPDC058470]|uniref:hypothetical protein n=1 Tax=Streptomyces sp. NPDC058470 TaxID=3346515 RepID=UPI00365B3838